MKPILTTMPEKNHQSPSPIHVPRLKFADYFRMVVLKVPILKIRKALAKCAAAGIAVTVQGLEAHFLCGKDPMMLADALVSAKELGVEATFQSMAALCMVSQDPMKVLLEASKERVAKFDTFSPTKNDRITGVTRDQQQVMAAITIIYTLSPIQVALGFNPRHVHERLGAAVSVFINTSPDMRTLQLRKTSHEAELKTIALEMLAGLKSLTIDYR